MPPAAEADRAGFHVREGRALGSRLRLVASSTAGIDAAWAAIVAEFGAVDATMSRFRDDSEVTRLNRSGRTAALSSRLRRALVLTDRARRTTGGRFDPRVLRDMVRLGFAGAAIDADAGVESGPDRARPAPRPDRITLCLPDGQYGLPEPVDLGGIGKGLALRWAATAARRQLAGPFLLDAGGDIATGGAPLGGWSIAIEDPAGGGPLATCRLGRDQSIATSSVRVGRLERADGPIHHLLDPRTGRPGGTGLASVTVSWRDPAWAEVWSKALFMAGVDGIAQEARSRGLAAWWVTGDGALSMTPAARPLTTWVRDEDDPASPRGFFSPRGGGPARRPPSPRAARD